MAKPLRPKRGTTAKNNAFTGLASEITIDTDKHSIRVHDGVTVGGHEILPKAKNDELYAPKSLDVGVTSFNGSKGAVTYTAPVTSVNGKTGAVSVDVGVTSFNGSTGAVTYSAPVTSVNGKTGAVTISTGDSTKIPISGSRGNLAGYESSGTATTINASARDSNQTGSKITVSNGTSGTSWTKIVRVTSAVSVTLGSNWKWQGGSAPTIKSGGILVCCWCGSGGIANFISPS